MNVYLETGTFPPHFMVDGDLLVPPGTDVHPGPGVRGEVLAGVVDEHVN